MLSGLLVIFVHGIAVCAPLRVQARIMDKMPQSVPKGHSKFGLLLIIFFNRPRALAACLDTAWSRRLLTCYQFSDNVRHHVCVLIISRRCWICTWDCLLAVWERVTEYSIVLLDLCMFRDSVVPVSISCSPSRGDTRWLSFDEVLELSLVDLWYSAWSVKHMCRLSERQIFWSSSRIANPELICKVQSYLGSSICNNFCLPLFFCDTNLFTWRRTRRPFLCLSWFVLVRAETRFSSGAHTARAVFASCSSIRIGFEIYTLDCSFLGRDLGLA